MPVSLQPLRPILLIAFTLAYVGSSLFNQSWLFLLTTAILLVILLLTLPLATPVTRRVSLALFCLGGGLLLSSAKPLSQWLLALGANAGLVAIFVALPFFSFSLSYDDYEPSLRDFSGKYINSPLRFATLYALLAFFLSSILNIGSFAVVYNLYQKCGAYKEQEVILWSSMTRANTAAIFWSPSYVAVAVVLAYTHVPWVQIIPQGLLLSLLFLLTIWISNIIAVRNSKNLAELTACKTSSASVDLGKLLKLLGISLLLLGLVGIFNIYTKLSIMVIIPLVALIYPLLLAFFQRKLDCYRQQLSNYYYCTLPNIRNEVVIFAAAGFFGKALELTGIGKAVTSLLPLQAMQQPGIFFLILTILISLLALLGVHPVVTTSAVASTFTASALGISPLVYTYILLAAYGFAVLITPFSATSLVLAGVVGKSSWEVGPKINLRYTVLTTLLFAIVFTVMS